VFDPLRCSWRSAAALWLLGTRPLEDLNKFLISTRHFKHRRFACRFSGPVIDERFPEICSSDGETDETRDAGCRRQPFANLLFVLTATKNDAADLFAATAFGNG
jgi:hypothetical protein